MPPLDRTAHARLLHVGTLAGLGDLAHGVEQFGGPAAGVSHCGIIESAAVLQLTVGIEAEEVGRADGIIGLGDGLVLIDQIGKREAVLFGECGHLRRAVGRHEFEIIRVDRDHSDALVLQRGGIGGQSVGNGLDVGAVIADERDQRALLTLKIHEAVFGAIGIWQGEGERLPAGGHDGGVEQHAVGSCVGRMVVVTQSECHRSAPL